MRRKNEVSPVKDLKSRIAIFVYALALFASVAVLVGCQGLVADPRQGSSNQQPTLVLGTPSITWGNVVAGSSVTLTDTLSNSGSGSITISSASISGEDFQIVSPTFPLTLASGQTATLSISFNPTVAGTEKATVTITSSAINSAITINLSATAVAGGQLAVSPSSFSFGNVNVGSSQTLQGHLTNSGSTSLTVTQATANGGNFSLSGLTLPLTLAAKQSVPFSIVFQPAQSGAQNGILSLAGTVATTSGSVRFGYSRLRAHDTSAIAMSVPLSGTGMAVGQLTASPGVLTFPSIQASKSETLTETLTNSTGSSVIISSATATGTGFSVTSPTLPVSVAAGQSVGIVVTYAPQSTGTSSGTLAIASTAPNSSLSFALSGTATAAPVGTLSVQTASLSFGSVQPGSSQSMSEVLTNTGSASVTITSATATGTGYTVSGMTMPVTVAAGKTASFTVTFHASQTAGTANGSVMIASNASNTALTIPLSATVAAAGSLSANPASVNLGTVQTGSSTPTTVMLTNSGGSSVTISGATATGTGYSVSGMTMPVTVAAGKTASFTVTLAAPQTAGTANGNVAIVSNASNTTLNIPLTAAVVAPGSISPTPTSVSFGNVMVGNNQLISETLKNTGGTSVSISAATITGSAFKISGLTLPLTLSAGQSFTFGVNFAPQATGNITGSMLITSNAPVANLTVALSGTGTTVGTLSVNPDPLTFGSVTVDDNQTMNGQLVATGGSVTVTSLTPSTGEFVVSGISLPVTVSPGTNVPFTVTFTPQASGAASANITIASNASNPSLLEPVSGTGAATVQHTVSLGWTASTGTIAGYNVYRGTVSGGPYTKLNSSTNASTSYTDSTVQSGTTYYYVTTAVDDSGEESANSNQATAVIP
jgi:hypothetical protein